MKMEKKKRQADYFSFFNEELYLPPVFRRGQNELNYAGIFFFFFKVKLLKMELRSCIHLQRVHAKIAKAH